MKRHRSTPEDKVALIAWLRRHSGRPSLAPQCKEHGRVMDMTDSELASLVREEIGVSPSRYWLSQLCAELGITRRARSGPKRLPVRERRRRHQRSNARYIEKMRKDPARWDAFMKDRRNAGKARRKTPAAV